MVLALALALATANVRAQRDVAPGQRDYPHGPDAVRLLREVWDVGAASIYPPELAARFTPARFGEIEAALRADGAPALADVVNPFLDELGVSHTRFYDARHQTYYLLRSLFSTQVLDEPRLYTLGVHLDEDVRGLVRAVMEGSPAASAGVLRGERIVSVDGAPFDSLLQWQRADPVELTIRGAGRDRDVTVTPVLRSFHRALADAAEASRRVFECGERRIGYVHLWSGTHPVFLDTLKAAVAEANRARLDGFILDLRDGYGGAWWPYLDPFFADRTNYFVAVTHDAGGARAPLSADPQRNPGAWAGPLVVLINDGTRSGKESLAFQFKKTGRARLIGTTTRGAFTGGRGVFADRDAGYLLYLAVQEMRLDSTRIEGLGVAPDRIVADSLDDAPLAAALSELDCA